MSDLSKKLTDKGLDLDLRFPAGDQFYCSDSLQVSFEENIKHCESLLPYLNTRPNAEENRLMGKALAKFCL